MVGGDRYADALAASEAWVAQSGALPVHAFDRPRRLLGQGTLGLELEEQAPELDTLLVAVGGGGLIGGIAAWYAGRSVSSASSPRPRRRLTRALAAGRPVDAEAGGIAADSLAPRRVGELMFPIAQRHVDRVVLVDRRRDPRRASGALGARLRIVAEPGGAAAFAALLSGRYRPRAGRARRRRGQRRQHGRGRFRAIDSSRRGIAHDLIRNRSPLFGDHARAFPRRRCSSSRGMISTKLQGR